MEYNPFSYALQDDPFAVYRWLRDEAPLYHNATLDLWALSRFDDVWQGHADWKTFSSAHGTTTPGLEPMYPWMLHSDPPEATRLRNLVSRAFTPARVARLEAAVRTLAEQTLEPLLTRSQCDIVGEWSARVPMDVISEMLGFPQADRARVREWAEHQVELADGSAERSALAREMEAQLMAYCAEVLRERRQRPRDDLMSALAQAEIEDETGARSRLSDRELLGFVNLLTVAGSETVSKFLGNAVIALAAHPEVRRQLVARPSLIPNAVEELLRHDGVVHYQARTLMRDVTCYGQTVPAGATVFLILGAANRDEREFAEPDSLDITRVIERRLYFGYGPHFCLGASLARLEARILLETLLAGIPEFEVEAAGLVRARTANLRGYATVPIRYRERGD